jgi:hypothetical protein
VHLNTARARNDVGGNPLRSDEDDAHDLISTAFSASILRQLATLVILRLAKNDTRTLSPFVPQDDKIDTGL